MKRIDALILFFLGLLVALLASRWVTVPGYMDADYYYAGGLRLAQGYGFSEPFVWNYLDSPQRLPHPAFTYWMPLPSLLATIPMLLTGSLAFATARLPFLLLAAFIPLLTACLAWNLTRNRTVAWLAAGFALLPGYYLPYLVTTESFGLCILLGGGLILILSSGQSRFPAVPRFLTLGVLAGFLHLSRADGLLWLLGIVAVAGVEVVSLARKGKPWQRLAVDAFAGILFGYALVTGFWYARNLIAFGRMMPEGGSKTLWLTEYNQTFTYHPEALSFSSWAASGTGAILKSRFAALLDNLKTWVGVQGSILLWPLSLAGLWSLRRERGVQIVGILWLAVLAFFSFVFPFAGARGGFFHSGAAFQPLIWTAAALGFDNLMDWGVRRRGWGAERSRRMFIPALLLLLLIFTSMLFSSRVMGTTSGAARWDTSWQTYRTVETELARLGAAPDASVMVNNPPGYFAATGRAAVVLPSDHLDSAVSAARHFGVSYLILDENTPPPLLPLYLQPASDENLQYLGPAGRTRLFRVLYPD